MRMDDYELLEEIGRGGMGVVFRARQVKLNRCVAVKVIRAGGLATANELKRFKLEAETAAALDHPNIVPIYEIGEFDGLPFFSMRLIKGSSLAANHQPYADDPRAAAQLMAALARTVHHAHERGVLHRDIKPSNVLIDPEGQPHLTDFGLAKRLRSDGGLSLSGAVIGTPNYMSPEQAAGKKGEITTAADIYSLGAVLYELLTGQPPFQAGTHTATLRMVIEEDCLRPRSLRSRIDRDLETITLKCLEKDPRRRYASAEALAQDLERWLRHEPIEASPNSPWDRAVKWTLRRPAVAALLGVTVGAVLVILGVIVSSQKRLTEQRNIAVRNAQIATDARQLAERQTYVATIRAAAAKIETGKSVGVAGMLDECAQNLRGWEWGFLRQQVPSPVWSRKAHRASIGAIALTADNHMLATADTDGLLRIWNLRGQSEILHLATGYGPVVALAFDPNGPGLIACGWEGVSRIDLESGAVFEIASTRTRSFCLSPDGRYCFVARIDSISSFETAEWGLRSSVAVAPDDHRFIATDGSILISGGTTADLPAHFIHIDSDGRLSPLGTMRLFPGRFGCGVIDPARSIITVACWRYLHQIKVPTSVPSVGAASANAWPALSWEAVKPFPDHDRPVTGLSFDPSSQWLITASEDGEVRIHPAAGGKPQFRIQCDESVTALAVGTSNLLFTGHPDGTVHAWEMAPAATPVRRV